jgi:hypothetical protein
MSHKESAIETKLHQKGMKRQEPDPPSQKPKGPSVDSEATRSSTAATPGTLGPRAA